jgi:hypothetical protein
MFAADPSKKAVLTLLWLDEREIKAAEAQVAQLQPFNFYTSPESDSMHNFSKNGLSGQYSVFKNSLLALSRSPARAFHRYYIHITHRTVCPISSAFDPGQWSGLALQFRNDTALDTDRLTALIIRHTAPYPHLGLQVTIRDSRKAPFSGTCFYLEGRIFVNIGRHNRYPYRFATLLAKAQSANGRWWREAYFITVADAYQLALSFICTNCFTTWSSSPDEARNAKKACATDSRPEFWWISINVRSHVGMDRQPRVRTGTFRTCTALSPRPDRV